MLQLKIYKTHPSVILPFHGTEQASCFDIAFQSKGKSFYEGYTSGNKPFKREMKDVIALSPGERVMVPTGLIMDIPEGHSVRLYARSGTSLKQGLMLVNGEAVIDSDYTKEVFVLLYNASINVQYIKDGDRIAQGELRQDLKYEIVQTAIAPGVKTSRVGGFGSTGIVAEANTIILNTGTDTKQEPTPPVKRGRGRPKKVATSTS